MLVYKTVIQLLLLYKASLTKVRFYGFGFYFYSTLLEGRYTVGCFYKIILKVSMKKPIRKVIKRSV